MIWDVGGPLQEALPLGNPFPLGSAERGRALSLGCLNSGQLDVIAAVTHALLVHRFILQRLNEGGSALLLSGIEAFMDGLVFGLTAYAFKDLTSCLFYLNRYMLFPEAVAAAGLL